MPRALTTDEANVLAHVVVDPAGWWANVQAVHPDPEGAVSAKVGKHRAAYEAASAEPGYQTRAEREPE